MKTGVEFNIPLTSFQYLNCELLDQEFQDLVNQDLKINFYDHILRIVQKGSFRNQSEIDVMFIGWSYQIHNKHRSVKIKNGTVFSICRQRPGYR